MIAPNDGNNGTNGRERSNANLTPGNPNSNRGASVGAALKRKLGVAYDGKIDRTNADAMADRLFEIVMTGRDSDIIKASELFRKAVDGDKITVAEVDSIEWSVDAEQPSPVPASLETNRLSQRGTL